MKIHIIYLFLIASSVVYCQQDISIADATGIIKSINNHYLTMKHYSISFQRTLHIEGRDSTINKTENGFMAYDQGNEYNEFDGMITIQDQKIRVIIDSQSKTITLLNTKTSNSIITEEIENTLKSCSKISLTNSDRNTISMQLRDGVNPVFNKVEIAYNPKTFMLYDITIYLKSKDSRNAKIVIIYTEQDKKVSKAYFETSKYIQSEVNPIVATSAYSNYKLFNNIIK